MSLLALSLLAFSPMPAEPARTPTLLVQERSDDAKDLKRLLRLADGRIIRARSRHKAGTWEVREGKRWVPLTGEVVAVQLERQLLRVVRERAESLGELPAARTEYAAWLLAEGLEREGFDVLDALLRERPSYKPALRVIEASHHSVLEPQQADAAAGARLRALMQAGAKAGPARRELAVREVGEFRRLVDLEQLVRLELRALNHGRRAFATLLAERLLGMEVAPDLASRAVLDGHEHVRVGAARALAALEDVSVIAPAINALGSKHANVRGHAAESLGNMGYPAAVEPLMTHLIALQAGGGPQPGTRANTFLGLQTAYVIDYDVEIAQGASIADPVVAAQASGSVFDVRSVVQMTTVVELRKTMNSLRQLTGATLGDVPADWVKWWNANRAQWRSRDLLSGAR